MKTWVFLHQMLAGCYFLEVLVGQSGMALWIPQIWILSCDPWLVSVSVGNTGPFGRGGGHLALTLPLLPRFGNALALALR